ncbi:ribosomal protein L11 methyltransferase [Chitinophaga skermanii]|uniref:Ribosomal protein L11 methyltransferase n=1 Tax=Chitinophaga skermanii TaxID=331697 RepID=A0A327QFW4_9BACT|nr:50S ribosomal protein L11 methyltransferase [Chitinophaga skermanii]RAJ02522.1 ribosomal protein L11 methyltransferase [Chitinophaga skermanii]
MNSISIKFKAVGDSADLLIAQLDQIGYEGFWEEGADMTAYILEKDFDEAALQEIIAPTGILYEKATIEPTNWNAVWESNFDPVIVDDFCGIRAHFHEPLTGVEQEIVITPKMSFGTGHHATTSSMIRLMRNLAFEGKQVFDFGTGTGILAILADKLGAAQVDAIDIDEWSIENTIENVSENKANNVKAWQADSLTGIEQAYDIILANINRHILVQFMPEMKRLLKKGGILLLSGILVEDETIILAAAGEQGLQFENKVVKDNWLAMQFVA